MKVRKVLNFLGCFTLIAVTCACMLFSGGCSQNEPKKEADGSLIITPDENQGEIISLLTQGPKYGISEYTLKVVFNDDCPENMKIIDWSIDWKDSSSEWASGKTVTDYVTLTYVSGALESTVKKVAAFGEQVIVTAMSRIDNSKKAYATIDCLKSVSYSFATAPTLTVGEVFDLKLTENVSYGTGTIEPVIDSASCKWGLEEVTGGQTPNKSANDILTEYELSNKISSDFCHQFTNGDSFEIEKLFKFKDGLTESEIASLKEQVGYRLAYNEQISGVKNHCNYLGLFVYLKLTYGNVTYRTQSFQVNSFNIDATNAVPYEIVQSVSFEDDSVVYSS